MTISSIRMKRWNGRLSNGKGRAMEERIQAIPTTYNGINFRSRLEAKWARFFDMAEWRWEYEPEDFGGYIPDFVLLGHTKIYVEVKPTYSSEEVRHKCSKAATLSDAVGRVLCLGATIGYREDQITSNQCYGSGFVLGFAFGDDFDKQWDSSGSDLFAAEMIICEQCNSLSWFLPQGAWDCFVCGESFKHYYKGKRDAAHIANTTIGMWKEATNATQYIRHKQKAIGTTIEEMVANRIKGREEQAKADESMLLKVLGSAGSGRESFGTAK